MVFVLILSGAPTALAAASDSARYQTPPEPLAQIVDAPPTPAVEVGPGRRHLLLLERPSLPPIAELAEPELRLGGLRFHPHTFAPSRRRPYSGLSLVEIASGVRRPVTGLPAEPRIGDVEFSPDGTRLAFTHTSAEGVELWVAEVASGEARRLGSFHLNLAAQNGPRWVAGSDAVVVSLVPEEMGAASQPNEVPVGPVVRENLGETAPARTYQDLLENPHDAALFEHYLSAQLARVELDGGVRRLGESGMVWDFDPSPDGRYLLVEILHRPFSYLVPAWRFPRRIEIWDADGELIHQIADLPLQEGVPIAIGSVPTGPRDAAWRADAPATVTWVEALDGGDAGAEAEERDRVFTLAEPFTDEPRTLATLALRYGGLLWGDDELALVTTWWWKTRTERTWLVRPGERAAEPRLLFDRSWEDRYNDPGDPVTVRNRWGRRVLLTPEDGGAIYLVGDGASPEGDRPFLDRLDLASKKSTRLFRSQAPYYEEPVQLLDAEGKRLLSRRESVDEPPNYFVRDVTGNDGDDTLRRLTAFPHPTPQLAGIHKELIRYPRADGVQLNATLYLPAGYSPEEDGPLPLLMWAYPIEYKDADSAGQVKDSPYRFDRAGWWSPLLWLTQGYAVLDDPTMPIIGEGDEEPNDTYVEQLVASARAAVDEAVRRGVTEEGRIAIGGHSYGAFMAANLLAHSDLFAGGIARSGAYNRTLTPFGFQAEERTVWQAPEVYVGMSPFMHAHQVNEPILLIHGDADNNSGTFPLQSERFYHALKGLGATTRLVMLPLESHGYRARESIHHMLWETSRWLESYVKTGEPKINP